MEKIPFHMGISVPVDLIVTLFFFFIPIDLIVALWRISASIDLIIV